MQISSHVSVRIRPEIAGRLQKFSELTEKSKSYLAAEAIEEYLDVHEWQIKAIKEGISAAESGQIRDFEEVKKYWERKFENKDN